MKAAWILLLLGLPIFAEPPTDAADPQSAPKPAKQAPPDGYTLYNPTGDQAQPIYFTKDMTFNIGTTQVGIYGFFKGDYLGETRVTGGKSNIKDSDVPLNKDLVNRKTQSILDARSSRLGIKIEDTVQGVKMKGAMEVDGNTTDGDAIQSNNRHIRLRLAYATAELPSHFFFLAGQYYALPMHYPEIDMPTRVNVNNFPPGAIDSRQPQFRLGYKQKVGEKGLLQYELGIESRGYNTTGETTSLGDTAQGAWQKWPVFGGKVSWLSESLKLDVVYLASKAYCIINSLGDRVGTTVWGAVSNGSYTWGNLILWGTIHHLRGLEGLSSAYLKDITLVNHGKTLKALKADGGAIALRYDFLKKALWTDVMYGVERGNHIEGSDTFSGTAKQKLDDFRINLVGAFWKHWQVGIEYQRTWVKAYNEDTGLDNSVLVGVWYIFGQP
jgi:hypothetical protein